MAIWVAYEDFERRPLVFQADFEVVIDVGNKVDMDRVSFVDLLNDFILTSDDSLELCPHLVEQKLSLGKNIDRTNRQFRARTLNHSPNLWIEQLDFSQRLLDMAILSIHLGGYPIVRLQLFFKLIQSLNDVLSFRLVVHQKVVFGGPH